MVEAGRSDPFEALGDPQRRQILRLLSESDRSVAEIAADLPISRPAVSRHLRLLKDAGLVAERAARHAADLPPAGRGGAGGAGLPRAGLGRGGRAVPTGRREHPTQGRVSSRSSRCGCPSTWPARREHAFAVWTAGSALVAGRPHGLGRPGAGRPGAAAGRADLRADAGRRPSTTGARSRSGSRPRGWATCGTSAATAPTPPRWRSASCRRRAPGDPRRDRAPRLGAARRRRPSWRDRNQDGWSTLAPALRRHASKRAET